MEIPKIERYVEDLLTVSGFREDGEEHHLWVLLRHLYSAVAMYEHVSDEDRLVIAQTQKKLKYFFETKCELKERKRRKKETEKNTPTPPYKEKENKKEIVKKTHTHEKENFPACLDARRNAFRTECLAFVGQYDNDLLSDFYNWWSEEGNHSGKMRFECERFFNVKRRLARWSKNSVSAGNTAAAIRLKKTKAKDTDRQAQEELQKKVVAVREQENARREEEVQRSKAGAISVEEYAARNPDSFLAKMYGKNK